MSEETISRKCLCGHHEQGHDKRRCYATYCSCEGFRPATLEQAPQAPDKAKVDLASDTECPLCGGPLQELRLPGTVRLYCRAGTLQVTRWACPDCGFLCERAEAPDEVGELLACQEALGG